MEMAESSRTTSLEHQMNSMMAEIVKLQRDVIDLNKEIGKKIYLSAMYLLQIPERTVKPMFLDITVLIFSRLCSR